MTKTDLGFELAFDELAFYFEADGGISADALGRFLQRTATIARQNGAALRVVAIHDGSLIVVIKVLETIRGSIAREFQASPLQTSVAAILLINTLVGQINASLESANPTPLAKAGAQIIEESGAKSIKLVTSNDTYELMDRELASNVIHSIPEYNFERKLPLESTYIQRHITTVRTFDTISDAYIAISKEADDGSLRGIAIFAGEELHFRPDGHRFLVPVEYSKKFKGSKLSSSKRYTVKGVINFEDNAPNSITIESATQDN